VQPRTARQHNRCVQKPDRLVAIVRRLDPSDGGRTLAVMQVSGGSQSFNSVNALRVLGRWMRMFTIPNQSSVPMAYTQFGDDDRDEAVPYDRMVDVMEELMKFTWLLRDRADYLVDRYSERKTEFRLPESL
jgi:arsenic resistance protein ArsH